ncbi:hypothetical protein CXK86_18505 [Paenibacillus sp. BGI2013]|nr:hypothetical protein C170_00589 [Paenibacillus sp. FSL H7-689]KLU57155.1 hypothetical protein EL84_07930 [Paenibacillus sp. VT-400]OME94167.1 hypothetical protein BK124_23440 [Paenibacillus amylolyticus]OMF41535.1 hypothetical protein BK136_20120 [Paenibacillus amylolyticus]PKQ89586.1 hypothetical protein CXK86_18505 [Paenibacillus sp. BGI2013]
MHILTNIDEVLPIMTTNVNFANLFKRLHQFHNSLKMDFMKLDIDVSNRFDLYLDLIEATKGFMKLIRLHASYRFKL